jgi:threonine dehydrogenase-like Zn-dependent dehydrogenase
VRLWYDRLVSHYSDLLRSQAAKIKGCKVIIGVDRITSRLDLSKEVGATHAIDTSDSKIDLVGKIKSLTEGIGASIVVDTTGNMGLIQNVRL